MTAILTSCGKKTEIAVEDMKITLTGDFKEGEMANTTWYYENPEVLAMGIRTKKSDLEKVGIEIGSLTDYTNSYIKGNRLPVMETPEKKENYICFSYEKTIEQTNYKYLTFVYEGSDTYWIVNFACYKELFDRKEKDFYKWADSVELLHPKKQAGTEK